MTDLTCDVAIIGAGTAIDDRHRHRRWPNIARPRPATATPPSGRRAHRGPAREGWRRRTTLSRRRSPPLETGESKVGLHEDRFLRVRLRCCLRRTNAVRADAGGARSSGRPDRRTLSTSRWIAGSRLADGPCSGRLPSIVATASSIGHDRWAGRLRQGRFSGFGDLAIEIPHQGGARPRHAALHGSRLDMLRDGRLVVAEPLIHHQQQRFAL
jgi:hypothetical protein